MYTNWVYMLHAHFLGKYFYKTKACDRMFSIHIDRFNSFKCVYEIYRIYDKNMQNVYTIQEWEENPELESEKHHAHTHAAAEAQSLESMNCLKSNELSRITIISTA